MIVQLENTSTCQAACHFCVYPELKRYGGSMSMDLFRKIVDESLSIGVKKYVIHGLGEPLLDSKLEDRIRYVRDTQYGTPVEIFTNGQFLTPKRFFSLQDAGLTSVVVSLNAVRPEQHEEIMGLKCYDTICYNLEEIRCDLGHVDLAVHACADGEHFTHEDAKIFQIRWAPHGKVFIMGNWAGDKDTVRDFDPNSYCARSDQTVYITYDGRVTMCCFDPTGITTFGDLSKEKLYDVYFSDAYKAFRKAHQENRAGDYEQCAGCNRI